MTSASPAPLTALPAPAAPTASETARPELAGPAPSAYPLPATPRGPTASRLVLAVSPILLRGEASPPELRIPPTVDTVAFELEGDPALLPRPDSRLEVAIETVEGGLVWRGEARRAAGRRAPPLVASAAVPSRVLAAGDYLLTLSEPDGGGGPLYRYFVRVVP